MLLAIPNSPEFRAIRRLYNTYLSPQHAQLFRKYQEQESRFMLQSLLEQPDNFSENIERYTMSVIFSAVFGTRIDSYEHPIVAEFNRLWAFQSYCTAR